MKTNTRFSKAEPIPTAARSIMVAHNLLENNEPYLEPDLTKSTEISIPKTNSAQESTEAIRVYPNPGRDYITIEYNLGNDYTSGSYEIVDQSGKVVKKGTLNHSTDQVVLDTRSLTPGNYYISLISNNKSVNSTRFVIFR